MVQVLKVYRCSHGSATKMNVFDAVIVHMLIMPILYLLFDILCLGLQRSIYIFQSVN